MISLTNVFVTIWICDLILTPAGVLQFSWDAAHLTLEQMTQVQDSVLHKTTPTSHGATGGVPRPPHFLPTGYKFGGSSDPQVQQLIRKTYLIELRNALYL